VIARISAGSKSMIAAALPSSFSSPSAPIDSATGHPRVRPVELVQVDAVQQYSHRHWDEDRQALDIMLSQTSTKWAPCYVVPADRKWFSRLATAAILVQALHAIDPKYPAAPKALPATRVPARNSARDAADTPATTSASPARKTPSPARRTGAGSIRRPDTCAHLRHWHDDARSLPAAHHQSM
jgi:hypothetical protein